MLIQSSQLVHYKGIQHEVLGDAPFIGARLLSIDCDRNCPGCFNQSLKDQPTLKATVEQILNEVQNDPFNEGVIFGGLEWTLQPKELISLVFESLNRDLHVIVYTGHSLATFLNIVPELKLLPILVKCGRYEETHKTFDLYKFGIPLASTNQDVVWLQNVK